MRANMYTRQQVDRPARQHTPRHVDLASAGSPRASAPRSRRRRSSSTARSWPSPRSTVPPPSTPTIGTGSPVTSRPAWKATAWRICPNRPKTRSTSASGAVGRILTEAVRSVLLPDGAPTFQLDAVQLQLGFHRSPCGPRSCPASPRSRAAHRAGARAARPGIQDRRSARSWPEYPMTQMARWTCFVRDRLMNTPSAQVGAPADSGKGRAIGRRERSRAASRCPAAGDGGRPRAR